MLPLSSPPSEYPVAIRQHFLPLRFAALPDRRAEGCINSSLLAANIRPKIIQEQLRYANIATGSIVKLCPGCRFMKGSGLPRAPPAVAAFQSVAG
jgi:hypothetical protein